MMQLHRCLALLAAAIFTFGGHAEEHPSLSLAWEPGWLILHGASIPGGEIRIHYLEASGETKNIRGTIYIVPADMPALLTRYAKDFPEHTREK